MPRSEKTVLFIDDEQNALSGWSLYLHGAGYGVVSAAHVEDGLHLFATRRLDAVVLDYRMPEMNGDEAAALMKRVKPEVIILMFSGDENAAGKAHPSINFFLAKGQPPSVLLDALDRLLGVEGLGLPTVPVSPIEQRSAVEQSPNLAAGDTTRALPAGT